MNEHFELDIVNGQAKLKLLGRKIKFDLEKLIELEKVINSLYSQDIFSIELDFSNISIITSLVLGQLVSYNKELVKRKGGFSIINANENIYEVFAITEINTIISVQRV